MHVFVQMEHVIFVSYGQIATHRILHHHPPHEVDTNLSHDCGTPATFDKPRQPYFRERYVNMTLEEREARREQQ